MKQISFFRMLDFSEVSTTARDLTDSVSRERSKRPTFDFVVEAAGQLLQLEHEQHEPPVPQIDWSRSFTLWNIKRERDAHYVFLETGEAVVTWLNLASLVGCSEDELSRRASPIARSLAVTARHGDAEVLCVRIDLVETFLNEVEQ